MLWIKRRFEDFLSRNFVSVGTFVAIAMWALVSLRVAVAQQPGQKTFSSSEEAYPAEYRSSGVMTFIVNQGGIVYQKDLGPNTAELARAIDEYDPDSTWQRAK
jgi:hypothetical protein